MNIKMYYISMIEWINLEMIIIEAGRPDNDLGFAYPVTGWQDTWEKLDENHVDRS